MIASSDGPGTTWTGGLLFSTVQLAALPKSPLPTAVHRMRLGTQRSSSGSSAGRNRLLGIGGRAGGEWSLRVSRVMLYLLCMGPARRSPPRRVRDPGYTGGCVQVSPSGRRKGEKECAVSASRIQIIAGEHSHQV